MWKSSKIWFATILSIPFFLHSQDCTLVLDGKVIDRSTSEPLELVNIYIEEADKGSVTDQSGYFEIKDVCPGHLHLILSHIGCQAEFIHLDVTIDTTLLFTLDHSAHELESITISDQSSTNSSAQVKTISEQKISDNSNENISNILSTLTGVHTIKNGSSISKPVVEGLFGNRMTILNNGIEQSGQQWGNDHSPEIDPLIANKIRVLKGAESLEYGGSSLGSIILVEPKNIAKDPHVHGKASYFFESNGLGNGLNLSLQKFSPKLAWKINGTLKINGDRKTPEYFLTNTGAQEANVAVQLEKSWSANYKSKLYLSTFNTTLGVLRGSHISNLTDLNFAFERDIPFFTSEEFSYDISAPKQEVNHHLIKLSNKYFLKDNQWFELNVAGQINERKEFDIRRGNRTEIPSLSLSQINIFGETKFKSEFENGLFINAGIQLSFLNNTNSPETGILPLIPDYLSYKTSTYFITSLDRDKTHIDLGVRAEHIYQSVVAFSKSPPNDLERFENNFFNFSTSLGIKRNISEQVHASLNLLSGSRNPGINELYSGGLHQGVSGIEEGNIELKSERSWKASLSMAAKNIDKFSFESIFHINKINDYIFLQPQEEIRLTIRGAFPVFSYEQIDARIFGFDLNSSVHLQKSLEASLKYSFLKGDDLTSGKPLVFIPSNTLSFELIYELEKAVKIGSRRLENLQFSIADEYVFKQNNLDLDQDFLPAPDGYNQLSFKVTSEIQFGKYRWRLHARVENALNTSYRNYLNRLRYFADNQGRNIIIGGSVMF